MLELTDEQKRALRQHEIPADAILDAQGMERVEWLQQLKRQNKAVAFTPHSPCTKGGHVFRLSSGHCMECSPQGVAHWKKYQVDGCVYIATSRSLGLHKIGTAKRTSDRADGLNRDGYAGATDWRISYRREFKRAGRIESQAQTALRLFAVKRTYTRRQHGTTITAKELFYCEYDKVRDAIEQFSTDAIGISFESGWGNFIRTRSD
jgi:hypothetical protein